MEQEEEGTFPSGGQRNRLVKTAIINLSLLVGLVNFAVKNVFFF